MTLTIASLATDIAVIADARAELAALNAARKARQAITFRSLAAAGAASSLGLGTVLSFVSLAK
jgi:hypothetical protein